jgi:hypothetical protein
VLSVAVGIIAASSIIRTFSDMHNPCVQWVRPGTGETIVSVAPEGCSGVTVHGQTRLQASVMAIVIPGGLLASIALFWAGIARSRQRLITTGAVLMLAETLVVFTIFPLTLLTGIAFAYVAYAPAGRIRGRKSGPARQQDGDTFPAVD